MAFFDEIVANNNKEWFAAQKSIFQTKVQQPAQQFVQALGARLESVVPEIQYDTRLNGSGSIMRIYRDTRFSADKTPYKTNLGILWWEGDGKKMENPGFYFHLDAESAWMGGGLYYFPDVAQYRTAVADEKLGPALTEVAAQMAANGMPVGGDKTKRVPRGFNNDHPRAELLKFKGMTAVSPPISRQVLASPDLVDICFEYCQSLLPLHQWLVRMRQAQRPAAPSLTG